MTKIEMVNHMIELGCIKEADRNIWLRKTKDVIKKVYDEIIPIRIAYLNK